MLTRCLIDNVACSQFSTCPSLFSHELMLQEIFLLMLLVFQNKKLYSFVIYCKVIRLQVHWTYGVNYSLCSLDCRTALEHLSC